MRLLGSLLVLMGEADMTLGFFILLLKTTLEGVGHIIHVDGCLQDCVYILDRYHF